MFIKIILSEN